MNVQEKMQVLEEVREGKLSRKEAAAALGCTLRTVYRSLQRVREQGAQGLVHGLTGRRSNRAKPSQLKDEVLALYEERYRGAAISAFTRDLLEGRGVALSRETVRRWLIDAGMRDAKPKESNGNG
jgi:transposase